MRLRKSIQEFAEAIEQTLRKKDFRGHVGWKICPKQFLEERLDEELQEYFDSKDNSALVDIASFCMMLYSRRNE